MSYKSVATKGDKERAKDVLERMTLAVMELCVGKGDVRSRLEVAVAYQLTPLQERNFPTEVRGKFRKIMQLATKYDASDLDRSIPLPEGKSHNEYEGRIQSTMRRIRRSTGANIARDIWNLYVELKRIAELDCM